MHHKMGDASTGEPVEPAGQQRMEERQPDSYGWIAVDRCESQVIGHVVRSGGNHVGDTNGGGIAGGELEGSPVDVHGPDPRRW